MRIDDADGRADAWSRGIFVVRCNFVVGASLFRVLLVKAKVVHDLVHLAPALSDAERIEQDQSELGVHALHWRQVAVMMMADVVTSAERLSLLLVIAVVRGKHGSNRVVPVVRIRLK